MDRVFSKWLSELSFKKGELNYKTKGKGAVRAAARVYEAARNALEYRAEHLVRRAAIERILRREVMLNIEAETMADHLDQELSWADYTGESEEQQKTRSLIVNALRKYRMFIKESGLERDFLIGILSSEIESILNPNPDYGHFSKLGYAYIRRKFEIANREIDLPLSMTIERVMNQADDQVVAYKLFELLQKETHDNPLDVIKNTYSIFSEFKVSKTAGRMSNIVKRNIGPIILLRDIYFADPENFATALTEKENFEKAATFVFDEQVFKMKQNIRRATIRSLIYIFLTKMLFVLILEVPVQKWTRTGIDFTAMGVNLALPLGLMWFLAATIGLPSSFDKEKLLKESWLITRELSTKHEDEIALTIRRSKMGEIVSRIFYILYAIFFGIVFVGILYGLRLIGFGILDMVIFLFFTSVVSFFAFRIRQSLIIYKVSKRKNREETIVDMFLLPLVVAGSAISKEVSRLNFLVFIFDFVLEMPFKSILRFVDGWFDFLSIKKEEVMD